MIDILSIRIKEYFSKKGELSLNIIKNVFSMMLIRLGSIFIGLILIPLTINYISPSEYGLWLTISSIVGWLTFFDVGLGNGMRNKVSASYATHNKVDSRIYVSTTYAILSIISIILAFFFIIVIQFVDWQSLFNVSTVSNKVIKLSICIVLITFCVQFVFNILNSVLMAVHKPALSSFITFTGQLLVLCAIYVLKIRFKADLVIVVAVLTVIPAIVLIAYSIGLYRTILKHVRPSFKFIDFNYFKEIFGLGSAFFVVQIGALVLFQTDNFIISKVLGTEAVTEFNIAFKLFSLITMVNFIIMTPYWNAYTHAWAKQDFKWMKNNLKIIRLMWLGLTIAAVVLYYFSDFIYDFWIGDSIKVSNSVTFAMLIYSIVITFQASHNYVINGIGKIKLQMYLMVFSAIFNIPLSLYLGGKFGIEGVIYSNVFFMLILGITFFFQINKLLNNKA